MIDADERLDQLEGQIRDEVDRRFGNLIAQYRQRAQELLTTEELEAFAGHLNALLENPDAGLSPIAAAVFQKLSKDPQARQLFDRLIKIIGLRDLARGSALPPCKPSQTTYAAQPVVTAPDTLRARLSSAAKELAQFTSNPEQWVGWMIFWLEALDKEAANTSDQAAYGRALERLLDMIANRLENERW